MALENGKLYLGVSGSMNYVGRYSSDIESLVNCQMMILQQGGQMGMSYPNYPHLLKKRFASNFIEVNIGISKFMYFIDVSELELGPEIEKIYVQITTGLDLNSAPEQNANDKKLEL